MLTIKTMGLYQPYIIFRVSQQQFPRENCGVLHENFQCQPINQDFYNFNSSGFDHFQPPQFPDIHQNPQETSKEILQAREDLMEAIEAFLKEYDHIPPNENCMALLLAMKCFLDKQAMEEEQNQPEVMQELILKLMNDLQILKGIQLEKEKQVAQGFIPYWNFSMIDDEEARDNFLKDVCTFLRKFSRIPFGITPKVILIAWERRRPKAITPDEPSKEPEDPLIMGEEELSTISEKDKSSVEDLVPIPSGYKGFFDDICDNDHFYAESLLSQDIPITSPKIDFLSEEFAGELAPIPPGMDEDEFDEEEDDSLNDNPTLSSFSYSGDNSFRDSYGQRRESFPRPPPEPPDVEICLHFELDAPVIDNFNELEEDQRGGEIVVFQNDEDDDSFTFVIRTFLSFLTYPVDSPLLLYHLRMKDTILDPGNLT
ncbi:hypothetical protein Tco_1102784 [Tanacetum coccineum]